jgi:hypothetical protein
MPLGQMAIFAGPSRSPDMKTGSATIFPPARSGDLRRAANSGFRHIVLSDTLFLDAPPNHREIMAVAGMVGALYGCSSAGALRAIELGTRGMRGCGVVHSLYQSGLICDDAELACVIGDDHMAVTPSLIEIRYYLGYLLELGATAHRLTEAFEALSSLYYMKRDYDAVNRILEEHLGRAGQAIAAPIEDPRFRIKAIDLENCLADIAVSIEGHPGPFRRVEINAEWLGKGAKLVPSMPVWQVAAPA